MLMFCSIESANKIESLQKHALQFLLDDNILCNDGSLENAGKVKMRVLR